MDKQPSYSRMALPTIISLFFFFGFIASSIDILIPVFKQKLNLEQWQAQMITFNFYVAYTVGSILYYFISRLTGGDLLNRVGYKNGIATGLCISAFGALLFYPAAQSASVNLMVFGYFIIGLGFSLLQTAVNPLTIVLGDQKKGSLRLSLAGGINNIGSILGPLVVSIAIFGTVSASGTDIGDLSGLKTPYVVIGIVLIIMAFVFKFSSIPDKIDLSRDEKTDGVADRKSVFNYPQLYLGMLGIFFYVGVEVSTAANLSEFMKQHANIPTMGAAPYVSLYWASLMIGRWTSSVGVMNLRDGTKKIMNIVMPFLAFGLFLLFNKIAGHDLSPFNTYPIIIIALIIANWISKGNPVKQLLLFSLLGILALIIGILSDGMISVYAFISVGLFCSTMWPCIYTLAIAGLGRHTNEGSGFLIMMIMGGGVISVLQGKLGNDMYLGIQWSYIVGVFCFLYLAFYAIRSKSILLRQGINYDTN